MIDKEKILNDVKIINNIEDDSQDELIKTFIEVAIGKLLELRYPFDLSKTELDLEKRFESWITRAVRSIYDTQGSYNITQFAQNGVQITYSRLSEGIDETLIRSIVPYAGVPK